MSVVIQERIVTYVYIFNSLIRDHFITVETPLGDHSSYTHFIHFPGKESALGSLDR